MSEAETGWAVGSRVSAVSSDDVTESRSTVGAEGQLAGPLDEMAAATDRLLASVDALSAEDLRGPSLLPGWTRAHVLAHIARNADGMTELVLGAREGSPRPMYAGGREQRDADIDNGSTRGLGDLRLDLDESAERLLEAFTDLPPEALGRQVTLASGATAPASMVPVLRVREVEIHHVDLDTGYTPEDWTPEFAARTLDQLSPFFLDQRDCPVGELVATDDSGLWRVGGQGPALVGATTELAAWLTGRAPGSTLAVRGEPEGTPVPPAPPWV